LDILKMLILYEFDLMFITCLFMLVVLHLCYNCVTKYENSKSASKHLFGRIKS
jgi:uncharacterized membrane protein YjfL (UPF0719 family)